MDISFPKLIKEFDSLYEIAEGLQEDVLEDRVRSVNLQIDATFFGRKYGFLVVYDGTKVIYFKEIKTESVKVFREAILTVKDAGYRILSVTVDGRAGYINNIRKLLDNIPVQMCTFHQKAIVTRYVTNNPKTNCGKELKDLMTLICKEKQHLHQEFIDRFYLIKEKYYGFLHERNELGQYKHKGPLDRPLDQLINI